MNNIDTDHIWHPYTGTTNPLPCYEIKKTKGSYLITADGKKLIDGMSNWWASIHGGSDKHVLKAIKHQTKKMTHVMFGGITHKPATELAQKLLNITPDNLTKIFYSDSGSVAVEVALKMAIQYWYSKDQTEKNRFLTVRNGYHGDTWHAMSVSDPENGMHSIFANTLPKQFFAPSPLNDIEAIELEKMFKKHHKNIAAFIIEPIVQGAGGMNIYDPSYLKKAASLCKKYDVLFIADEIATGFGRTGKMFACNHANVQPDIMCLGKAITGGNLSFAATLATDEIADSISAKTPNVFMHGPTFMGNPLACSAANASIKKLLSSDWEKRIAEINTIISVKLETAKTFINVESIRSIGAIGVIEMKEPVNMAQIQKEFVEAGVWIRPFGKLVYIMPPFSISNRELNELLSSMLFVVANHG